MIDTNTQAGQDNKTSCIQVPAVWTENWPGLMAQVQKKAIYLIRSVCISMK